MALSRDASRQIDAIAKRFFREAPKEVEKELRPAVIKAGEELADLMRRNVPRLTGELAASIDVTHPGEKMRHDDRTAGPLEAIVSAGSRKAFNVWMTEFGTSRSPANPFFRTSYRAKARAIKARLSRAYAKAMRKFKGNGGN